MLLVGDIHATADDLEDCQELIKQIESICKSTTSTDIKPDYIVFLGDQMHSHAVLNAHVLNFWKESLLLLRPLVKDVICLVGNHDLPGNTGTTKINSMSTLDHLCLLVDDHILFEDVLFVAYQANNERFVEICHNHADTVDVVCHQTFNGAQYENGFYATDGIQLLDLPPNQKYFSGHIHSPHRFGNVEYVGAPRYRTVSDASVRNRSLLLVDFEDSESPALLYPTHNCRKIRVIDIVPGKDVLPSFKTTDVTYFNLIGPTEWVEEAVLRYSPLGIVKKFPTDTKTAKVKESDGIDIALLKYIDSVNTVTPKETIKKLIEERLWATK